MDKTSLLGLLYKSTKTDSQNSWIGTSKCKPPPPFGKCSFSSERYFNEKVTEMRFGEGIVPIRSCFKKSEINGRAVAHISPLKEYERQLMKQHGDYQGKALAHGMATKLPGCTIAQRPISYRKSDKNNKIEKVLSF